MKHFYKVTALMLALGFGPAFGQVEIGRTPLGSGEPGASGFQKAEPVYDNLYHVPQYMPGYPTAAIIWPRVIEVPCKKVEAGLQCDGYHWTPNMGRAEYLYFVPVLATGVPVSTAPEPASLPPIALVVPMPAPDAKQAAANAPSPIEKSPAVSVPKLKAGKEAKQDRE